MRRTLISADEQAAEIKRKIRRAAARAIFDDAFAVCDVAESLAENLGVSFDEAVALVEEYDRQAKSAWWHRHILRFNYCAACNVRSPDFFMVPDCVCASFYVPEELRETIICHACWRIADDKERQSRFRSRARQADGRAVWLPTRMGDWRADDSRAIVDALAARLSDYTSSTMHTRSSLRKEEC